MPERINRQIGVISILALILIPGCLEDSTETTDTSLSPIISGGITSHTRNVRLGEPISIRWWYNPPEGSKLVHTGIHYGYSSTPGELGTEVDITTAGYTEVAIPEVILDVTNFGITITPTQKGILYFRAHAIVDGKNYWTEERAVTVE